MPYLNMNKSSERKIRMNNYIDAFQKQEECKIREQTLNDNDDTKHITDEEWSAMQHIPLPKSNMRKHVTLAPIVQCTPYPLLASLPPRRLKPISPRPTVLHLTLSPHPHSLHAIHVVLFALVLFVGVHLV
jgi:hypothetical protein